MKYKNYLKVMEEFNNSYDGYLYVYDRLELKSLDNQQYDKVLKNDYQHPYYFLYGYKEDEVELIGHISIYPTKDEVEEILNSLI